MQTSVIRNTQTDEKIDKVLSIGSAHYLNSHRLKNTPYFPFVMGLEYFTETAQEDIKNSIDVIFEDFKVEAPLLLRRDRDKSIFIKKSKSNVSIADQRGTYFSSAIKGSKVNSIKTENGWKKKIGDTCLKLGREIYRQIFPHGPHFQNNFTIYNTSADGLIARQHDFCNQLDYIDNKKCDDLALNPAFLDGILQLCVIHSITFDKAYLLPVSVKHLSINLSLIKKIQESYTTIVKKGDFTYDAHATTESGEIIATFRDLKFTKLSQKVPELFQ